MADDIQAVRDEFSRLLGSDAKEAVIDLLAPLVRSGAAVSADDAGWAYWNICDSYAMLRKPREQYGYQSKFFEWSKSTLPALKGHWVVSDATQALTLISGGFLEFWWNCYQFANESTPLAEENRTVRFESHRANAAAYTRFREFDRAETALQLLEAVLSEDASWVNRDFAAVTWITLLIKYYAAVGDGEQVARQIEAVVGYLDGWLARLQRPVVWTEEPLLGSWEQLNAERPAKWIFVAIHNAACASAVAGQFVEAERLFNIFLAERRSGMTTYSKAMYMLACWQNRRSKGEIGELFSGFQPVALEHILKFAPELSEVFGE